MKWELMNLTDKKHGGEGEVTKIRLKSDHKNAAAIKIYRYDTRTRKMRAYRELFALKKLNGKSDSLLSVSYDNFILYLFRFDQCYSFIS